MSQAKIPATVITGFLGAGKTTLLRHMLQAEHGLRLAVIENEFSETPIDGQLLGDKPVELLTLASGCVCCSIHVELEKALFLLLDKLDANGGKWPAEISGVNVLQGIKDGAVGIPTEETSWRFSTFTVDEYTKVFNAIADGTLVISDDIATQPATSTSAA